MGLIEVIPDNKVERIEEVAIICGSKEVMRLFSLILCLPHVNTDYVIRLSAIFSYDKRTEGEFKRNQLYKLRKWLDTRTLTMGNIVDLLELVKEPKRYIIFKDQRYLDTSIHKKLFVDPEYKCLIPTIVDQLS